MQVNTKEFFKAVEYVSKATIGGHIPALTRVRIDAEPGRLIVSANNLDVLVATEVPADGVAKWTTLVDPVSVKGVKPLAGDTIEVTARRHEGLNLENLVINTGNDEIELNGVKNESFVDWWQMRDDNPHIYGVAELTAREMSLIEHLLNHTTKDDSHPVLKGVYLDKYGWTATDTSRLLHVPASTPPLLIGIDGVIVAPDGLEMLAANPFASEQMPVVEIKGKKPDTSENPRPKIAYIEAGPVRIWSRLIDARFPPYRYLFEISLPEPQFSIMPEQYPKIKRVLATAKRLTKRGPCVIRFGFEDGQLALESVMTDTGTIRSKYPVKALNGTTSTSAHLQAKYIDDMISVFDALDEPVVATIVDDPYEPCMFTGVSGVTCIIMTWRR